MWTDVTFQIVSTSENSRGQFSHTSMCLYVVKQVAGLSSTCRNTIVYHRTNKVLEKSAI